MDHTQHTPLRPDELNDDIVKGADIYDAHDKSIGKVSHLQGVGPTGLAVVDVGGFLGICTKPVAISQSNLNFMRDENDSVHATSTLTQEQLKDLPEHTD